MQAIRKLLLLGVLIAFVAGCSAGRTAFNKAEKLEREGNLDEAVLKYAEASAANPDVGEYRVHYIKASETAARVHLKKGDALLDDGKYDEALREFEAAYAMDSSLERAQQQKNVVVKLRNALVYYREGVELEKGRKGREAYRAFQKAVELNPDLTEAREAMDRLLAGKRPKVDGYELNLKSTKPITLKFKDAKLKEVFTILSQLSGINFIFDEALKDQNVTVYLENASFQQALDILSGINKVGKKVLNENTIILYPKNPEKIKQYEELLVETFYLNKLDAKKAVNLIRTMLQVRKIYVNEEMNALVLRDTPDVIEVARKIIEANDVPDAEVVLEVEVIEISKRNQEKFGMALSNYAATMGVFPPGSSGGYQDKPFAESLSTATTINTGTTINTTVAGPANLLQVFDWKGYGGFITVPSATFNFGKSLANGETLANPRIRVKNREKAKFNVGQRVPITTTSSPTGGGVSVNVQYVDVGVKLNAEPTIQLSNDVSIKLSMEVSSILSREKVGSDQATTVVTIGTRNLDTVLNLKDGETSIIGGLIQNTANKSKQKVLFLGDLPLLGPLFSSNDDNSDKSELVLAITPRIVKAVTIPDADVTSFWSGKEDEPTIGKLYTSFNQEPEIVIPAAQPAPGTAPAPRMAPAPGPMAQPAENAPMAPAPQAPQVAPQPPQVAPQPPQVAPQPPQVAPQAPPIAPQAGAQGAPTAPVPGGQVVSGAQQVTRMPSGPVTAAANVAITPVTLALSSPSAVRANDHFTVEVVARGAKDLYSAPFSITYDPKVVDFVGATEGTFLKQDGKPTAFQINVDKGAGRISVSLGRIGAVGGVAGSGALINATFKATTRGTATFGLAGMNFTSPSGEQMETIGRTTVTEVK